MAKRGFVWLVGALVALAGASAASANVPLTQVSSDPFTNTSSQHATELEPDTFAFGSTVVSAFQVGRFFGGGATDIGFATSHDGGATWIHGFMPGMTSTSGAVGSPFEAVSDASVAYDARHATWLISSIPILPNGGAVPTVFVNRSTDGGSTWSTPVSIPPPAAKVVNLDKNWTVCDNHAASPFYGHCYTELDNFGADDVELMSTSTDGGVTWSAPIATDGRDKGLGGQPVVQPSGRVVVPFEALNGTISSFISDDGGQSWSHGFKVAGIRFHGVAGGLRTSPLPSAEIAADGKVYVAWEDCRFRVKCASNDIVFSTSTDGVAWTDPARIPIDPASSTVDHFIPGLGVDPGTKGGSAHLGLTYYYFPTDSCTTDTCKLFAGYVSSADGGANWSEPKKVLGPLKLAWLPSAGGRFVGDYVSTSFMNGRAFPVIANAKAGTSDCTLGQITSCKEFMVAPKNGLGVTGGTIPLGTEAPVPGARSDHGPMGQPRAF